MMAVMQQSRTDDARAVEALRSASLTGEAVPRRVLIAPWGAVESTNGSFVVDEESGRLVLKAFEEHGTDLPIDYEHQTLGGHYSSPNGQAPAAGWIKQLLCEAGVGLLAEIEWTQQAEKVLATREYRYLSPVAIIRKTDRKLVALHSAALTNKPAIVGMQPIVNRVQLDEPEESAEPMAQLRMELALPSDAGPADVLIAAGKRLVDLKREAKQQHIENRLTEALRAGKLVAAQRDWAEVLLAREEALFDEWLRSAPVVVSPGALAPPGPQRSPHRRHQTIAARARAEYRAHPLLARLTTEEAYTDDALREAGGRQAVPVRSVGFSKEDGCLGKPVWERIRDDGVNGKS